MKRFYWSFWGLLGLVFLMSCAMPPSAPIKRVSGGVASDSAPSPPPEIVMREVKAAASPLAAMEMYKATATPPRSKAYEPAAGGAKMGLMKPSPGASRGVGSRASPPRPQTRSGLKAGFADDNQQFNYFVNFLERYRASAAHFPLPVQERIIIRVRDKNSRSLPNAKILISSGQSTLITGKTYADGAFLFFPAQYDAAASDDQYQNYRVVVEAQGVQTQLTIERYQRREIEVRFDFARHEMQQVPLDILFILDTTGSMGEEISRLKRTIEIIKLNLASLASHPRVRFGMVLYKDRGDTYVTRIVPLVEDLEVFQGALNKVTATGGGDTPEDLQAALYDGIHRIQWQPEGIRLAFVITDAPPHLDYSQSYAYTRSAIDAKERGIKIFSIGTGGLNLNGEYVLRQIAQYTYGKYIFLTYGEKGESGGGQPGSVSHHTGANYQTDKLEAIIIRFAKEELNHLMLNPMDMSQESFFQATRIDAEQGEDTLKKLFDQAIEQLVDYSSLHLTAAMPLAVIPIVVTAKDKDLLSNAEYFTMQLTQSVTNSGRFSLIERENLQQIMAEMKLQLSGVVEESSASEVGKILGAKLLLFGKLYQDAERYNLFIKLVRVETGEILAVTKARIDKRLGIGGR